MKKIIFLTSMCLLIASISFAGDLAEVLDATALSNKVQGHYFSDGDAFVLQTGHEDGSRAFGSGSFATTISYQDVDDPTADILGTSISYDSSDFDSSSTSWKALGE